jgi:capsular exopolysaccharide synthesis family protein
MTEQRQETLLTHDRLTTHFAEAYRALRANISFTGVDEPVRTVAVTSASSGEGKTTTVINLGIIMAQAGPRVLIVDCDFRRPTIDLALGLRPSRGHMAGLSNVIVGTARLDDVIVETQFDRLGVVPAGAMPPNPSELLGSQRMQGVVRELSDQANIVLFDTPPCMVYADAVLIARLTDGVLYVLRRGNQNKAAQRRIQKQLQQAKVRMLGAVFNDVEVEENVSTYNYYYANGNKRR